MNAWRRSHGLLGIAVLVASVVAGCGSSGPSSTPGSSPRPSSGATVSPSPETRYPDGIPRAWGGEPVLRDKAAMDRANASTDSTPFLIAVWAGFEPAKHCPAVFDDEAPGVYWCNTLVNVGDQPGVPSEIGKMMRMDLNAYVPGPLILRVHTHDKSLAKCPAANAFACEHAMVLDEALWKGDEATAPRPTTIAQAATALGLPATPAHTGGCVGGTFTGAAVLAAYSADGSTKEIAVVFPTVAALASVVTPAAAEGEMVVHSAGHDSCTEQVERQGRQVTLRVRWLARGNMLVGIMYDEGTNPETDPTVLSAREALAQLPAI